MKKILLPLLTLFLILTSCSSDDSEENSIEVPKLLTNMTRETENVLNSINSEYIFNSDNQIISLKLTNGFYNEDEFIYNNGLVLRYNRSYDDINMGQTAYVLLEYENNRVSRLTQYDIDDNMLRDFSYTYNSSGILLTRNFMNIINDTERTFNYIYDANQNTLTRTEEGVLDSYLVYTFDNGFSPYTNIPHILKEITAAGNILNNNNISKIESYENDLLTSTIDYLNEYDSDNFLIRSTRTDSSNIQFTTIETYTYNK